MLRDNGTWLGFLWLLSWFVPEVLSDLPQDSSQSGPNIPLLLTLASLDMTLSFLIFLFLPRRTLELVSAQAGTPLSRIFAKFGKDLVAEQLRVAASVIKGCLMLLVPGFIRYIQYTFVTILVTVDPRYQDGQIDALEHSKKLTRGALWPLACISLILLFFDLGIYLLDQFVQIPNLGAAFWAWQGVTSLLSLLLRVYSVLLIFFIYQRQQARLGGST